MPTIEEVDDGSVVPVPSASGGPDPSADERTEWRLIGNTMNMMKAVFTHLYETSKKDGSGKQVAQTITGVFAYAAGVGIYFSALCSKPNVPWKAVSLALSSVPVVASPMAKAMSSFGVSDGVALAAAAFAGVTVAGLADRINSARVPPNQGQQQQQQQDVPNQGNPGGPWVPHVISGCIGGALGLFGAVLLLNNRLSKLENFAKFSFALAQILTFRTEAHINWGKDHQKHPPQTGSRTLGDDDVPLFFSLPDQFRDPTKFYKRQTFYEVFQDAASSK